MAYLNKRSQCADSQRNKTVLNSRLTSRCRRSWINKYCWRRLGNL